MLAHSQTLYVSAEPHSKRFSLRRSRTGFSARSFSRSAYVAEKLTSSPAFPNRPSSMPTITGRSKTGLLGAIFTTALVAEAIADPPASLFLAFRFRRSSIKNRFSEVVVQALYPDIVRLADVFTKFLSRGPENIPGHGPRSGIRAWVIDRRFVMQSVFVGARD